jgi:hypothetical protein
MGRVEYLNDPAAPRPNSLVRARGLPWRTQTGVRAGHGVRAERTGPADASSGDAGAMAAGRPATAGPPPYAAVLEPARTRSRPSRPIPGKTVSSPAASTRRSRCGSSHTSRSPQYTPQRPQGPRKSRKGPLAFLGCGGLGALVILVLRPDGRCVAC